MSTTGGFDPYSPQPPEEPIPVVFPVEPDWPLVVVPVEPPRPPHPGFWMSLLWCLVFFLVLNLGVVLFLVPVLIFEAAHYPDKQAFLDSLVKQNASNPFEISPMLARALAPAILGSQITAIVFAWLMIRLLVGRNWRRELAVRSPSLTHLGLILLGMPAFLLLPDLVAALAKMVLPTSDYQQGLNDMFQHWPWWYGVLAIGFGAGIGEELWCRGFIGRGLLARYGVWGGVLLTSLLFGLMHLDPPHVIATMFMGIALHFVYLATRSLVASMLVHTVNNATSFLLVFLMQDNVALKTFLESLDGLSLVAKLPLYGACALLLAVVAWALYQSRVRVVPSPGGSSVWPPAFPSVADPPPESSAALQSNRPTMGSFALVVACFLLVAAALWWTGKKESEKSVKPSPAAGVIVS